MKVLITGGAGFIGSHTADALLKQGHAVRVLDSLEEPIHPRHGVPKYLDERIEFVRGDVRDASVLLEAMRGCIAVYHLAAFQDYLPTFSRFFDVNVTSTALIYELMPWLVSFWLLWDYTALRPSARAVLLWLVAGVWISANIGVGEPRAGGADVAAILGLCFVAYIAGLSYYSEHGDLDGTSARQSICG